MTRKKINYERTRKLINEIKQTVEQNNPQTTEKPKEISKNNIYYYCSNCLDNYLNIII